MTDSLICVSRIRAPSDSCTFSGANAICSRSSTEAESWFTPTTTSLCNMASVNALAIHPKLLLYHLHTYELAHRGSGAFVALYVHMITHRTTALVLDYLLPRRVRHLTP